MALFSESRLKVTSRNTLTHLLQGTTQTLPVIHISPLLLSNTIFFFVIFHFVTISHAGAFLNRVFAISISFPTYPCLAAHYSKITSENIFFILFHYFNCSFPHLLLHYFPFINVFKPLKHFGPLHIGGCNGYVTIASISMIL